MFRVALLILAAIVQSQKDRPRFLQSTGKPSARACGKFWMATCRDGAVRLYSGDQPATDSLVFSGSIEEARLFCIKLLSEDATPEAPAPDPTITEEAFLLPPATFDTSDDGEEAEDGEQVPAVEEEAAEWEADLLPAGSVQPSKLKDLPADLLP